MTRKSLVAPMNNERGVALIVVALGLTAFLGVAALALDMGMLYTARTESQRVADAAALAGAGRLLASPNDEAGARQEAIDYAAMQNIRGQPADVQPSDVEVFLGLQRVRVTVRNTLVRGNAIPTYFARILGFDQADVVTVAMAEVAQAGTTTCDLPLALPNAWTDVDGDGKWDPDIDTYVDDDQAHYADGEKVALKLQPAEEGGGGPPYCTDDPPFFDPCNAYEDDSWRCWWLPYPEPLDDVERNDDLRRRILGECPDDEENWEGEYAYSTPGNAQALLEELATVVDRYTPGYGCESTNSCELWNTNLNCVVRPVDEFSMDEGACLDDPESVRSVPLIHPDEVFDTGNNRYAGIIEHVGVRLEKTACADPLNHREGPKGNWNLYVRFTDAPGEGATGPLTGNPTVKVLRLIE